MVSETQQALELAEHQVVIGTEWVKFLTEEGHFIGGEWEQAIEFLRQACVNWQSAYKAVLQGAVKKAVAKAWNERDGGMW